MSEPPLDPVARRIAGLPPLRESIAEAGLRADRRLGQNFLLDRNLLDRIVRDMPLAPGDRVYEVGPGPGGLTRALLKSGARVIAVERDARAIPLLQSLAAVADGRLTVLCGDAMAVDAAALAGEGAHIAANLPYNIGTALLVGWLSGDHWPPWWRSATLMFQAEVAQRLVAAPGSAAYGRLSVLAQWRCRVRIMLGLPPAAFTPSPKVSSAVVQLVPVPAPAGVAPGSLAALTAAAFGQRRKMLRQSLKGLPGALDALAAIGIAPERRAETLAVADYVALSRTWQRLAAHAPAATGG